MESNGRPGHHLQSAICSKQHVGECRTAEVGALWLQTRNPAALNCPPNVIHLLIVHDTEQRGGSRNVAALRPGGHDLVAYPSCLRLVEVFSFSPRWSSPSALGTGTGINFRGIRLISFFCFSFSFLSLSFVFSLSMRIWVAGVRVSCLSYPVRWHGIALSTTFTALRCITRNKGPHRSYYNPIRIFPRFFWSNFFFCSSYTVPSTIERQKHALRQTAKPPNQSLFVPAVYMYLTKKLTFTSILFVPPVQDLSK